MAINLKELKKLTIDLSVLYVEDESRLRDSVEVYLKKLFNSVDSAKDGEEGLSLALKNKYDLIITDINMPKMDGLEMSKKIKESLPEQNILITSAYSDSNKFTDSIEIGIDGYIIKPINLDQLNSIIFKIATKIKHAKENEYYKDNLEEMVKEKTKEVKKLNKIKVENYKKTLYALIDIVERRDTYTGGHSQRVAEYSKKIAKKYGFDKKECEEIYQAGILHDIGKVAIPDSILLKPNRLNNIEYNLIQKHALIGYEVLHKIPMFESLAKIVKHHHEKFDGTGYPDGLKGEEIPVAAQIMSVADSFDAMTTSRIYKGRKTVSDAFEELKGLAGVQYSKEIVDRAIDALKDVQIDENINQLPIDELEKERFAYFYKDQVSRAYNKNYLELILFQNSYKQIYNYSHFVELNNFNKYNQTYGWDEHERVSSKPRKFYRVWKKQLYNTYKKP
jgi:putative nucleotidyltransferase with HDIG domain